MSIDKLKSIAETAGRKWWVRPPSDRAVFGACVEQETLGGIPVTDTATTEKLRAALRVAIAQLEIYEGAIEFYGKVYNHDNCFRPDLGTYVLANTEGSSEIETDRGFRARQAKLEADEILKGVAE